ncbi:Uncharacterised protein [Segatella copri]|nr:Uncharacterised protein [Segatella copri]
MKHFRLQRHHLKYHSCHIQDDKYDSLPLFLSCSIPILVNIVFLILPYSFHKGKAALGIGMRKHHFVYDAEYLIKNILA